jgi:hypothetical protein
VLVLLVQSVNPLNAELNPIRHLLALVGARHVVHVSRIRVNYHIKSWTGVSPKLVSLLEGRETKV